MSCGKCCGCKCEAKSVETETEPVELSLEADVMVSDLGNEIEVYLTIEDSETGENIKTGGFVRSFTYKGRTIVICG